MLSMLLLGRVDYLQKKLAGELQTEATLSEDLQELKEKLDHEIRAKHKLEEKLEINSMNNEMLLEEQLSLVRSEYENRIEELISQKHKEVELVILEEERIKVTLPEIGIGLIGVIDRV
jgi:adenine-specific DNA methylase